MSKINTKQEQFEALIEIMGKNREFAKGYAKTLQAKTQSNILWKQIEIELNLLGPPVKDVDGWKRVWSTYKDSIKKKIRRNKQSISGTGGGRSKFVPLTPKEEILNMQLTFSGIPQTKSFGPNPVANLESIPTKNSVITSSEPSLSTNPILQNNSGDIFTEIEYLNEENSSTEPNIVNIQAPAPPAPHTTSSNRKNTKSAEKGNRTKLLKTQITQQKEFHTSVLENLSNINIYLKKLHQAEIKKIDLQNQSIEIQKQYIQILKRQNIKNIRRQHEKLKIKKRALEIKEIKLARMP